MKTPSTSVPHILLVDDNRDGLLVRRLLLEEMGCRVEVAVDGEEGLKLFESSNFDVVVVDYRMPRMNGVEMIARVRAKDATARIILLSSVVEPLGLTEENTGADVVIAKNAAEPTHLARSIKRLLNRAPLRKPPGRQKGGAPRARAMAR
ncbi:MAG: response regulator [Bryobacteraceae bacterium]|jgi:CheY-like chemotaxis protein